MSEKKVHISRRAGSVLGRFAPVVLIIVSLTGCKPTENNYKAAYDAALAKRESADADRQAMAEGHQILTLDGPQKREIDGAEVYVETRRVRPEGEWAPSSRPRYMVGVGVYRMGANAKALAERLRSEGYDAFLGRDSDDRLWVVIPAGTHIKEAAAICREFERKHKDLPWTGLPGAPVVID